ncbi:MAG: nitrate reductase [Gammaproteobacteria bacterium]
MSIGELVDGPLWYASLGIFVVGVALRLIGALMLGSKPDFSVARGSASSGAIKANLRYFLPRKGFWPRLKMQVVAGYLFHLGLFALLFFALPHVQFYERVFGLSLPVIPNWAFILAAEAAFLGLMFLWLHRVMHPVTQAISDRGDRFTSWLIFLVMLTGCLALGRTHESLRIIHFLLAELLLAWFPFSTLMHTFTFAFSRGAHGAHFGRRGVPI